MIETVFKASLYFVIITGFGGLACIVWVGVWSIFEATELGEIFIGWLKKKGKEE